MGVCVGEPDGKSPPARSMRTFQNNTKTDLQKIELQGGGGVNRIDLAHDREISSAVVYTIMNFCIP